MGGHELQHPGGTGGLHRMRDLCGDLPGEEQGGNPDEGSEHGPATSAATPGTRELGVLPEDSGTGPTEDQDDHHPAAAGAGTVVRVLGRLLGLWRDAVPETALAAIWGPRADRQCHGLLVDLRRESSHHAM